MRRSAAEAWGACCLAAACPLAPAQTPEVGPRLRLDHGGGIFAANEMTVAAGIANPDEIVAAWNDWRESPSISEEIIRVGAALSLDGGATWEDFLVRPPEAFQTTVEGDPMTAADPRTGTLWVGGISFGVSGGLFVARKGPGAGAFEPAVMALTGGTLDKPWMTAGPRPDRPDTTRLYIALNEGILWSDDLGDTWTAPLSLGPGLGFLPRVGPAGELYVAHWHVSSNEYRLQRSLDGGRSFTTHLIAVRLDDWSIEPFNSRFAGHFRVPPLVYLAVDPNDGGVYATFMDTTEFIDGQANVDIYFTRSYTGGETWSTPVVINGDADPPGDQLFPWIEVDPSHRLHVVYLDSRHTLQDDNDENGMFDAYYAVSGNMGGVWSEFRLTPGSWNSADDGLDRTDQFLGDYLGLAVTGDRALPVYLDASEGDPNTYTNLIDFTPQVDADVNDDGMVNVQDLTQVILDWGPCPDPPVACASDTNADGVIDIQDLVNVILLWT